MQTIHWYPGHMAKAKRMLEDSLKLIDVVIELVDARAPLACRNPDFEALFKGKIRVIILNKSDLSARQQNKAWIAYFSNQGVKAIEFISTSHSMRNKAIELIEAACADKIHRYKERGINKTLRAMVVGIPNVGKSTFINRLAGQVKAQVSDRPGVTRGKQWVKVSNYLELMDTPGLLWGKLDNEEYAKHVAYIGSIRDDIMDVEEIATLLLADLMRLCPNKLIERYKKLSTDALESELLSLVAKSRGFILSGGIPDTERAARIVLDEYRAGKIASIALECPMQNDKINCDEQSADKN